MKSIKGNMSSKKAEEKGVFDEWQGLLPGGNWEASIGNYSRSVLGFDIQNKKRVIIEEDVLTLDTNKITEGTMILYKKSGKSGKNMEDYVRDAFQEYLGEVKLYGENGKGGDHKMNCDKLSRKDFTELTKYGVSSDCMLMLLAADTESIVRLWKVEEGKEICRIANLSNFLASLIAAFGIPQSVSPGARAWNGFPVLLAMIEHNSNSEHLYETIFIQQFLLVCLRIGAALMCNVKYDEVRKLFIALGAAMENGMAKVHLNWKKNLSQKFAQYHPSKMG